MMKRSVTFFTLMAALIMAILISCNRTSTVYLSDLKQGFIANEFGPPEKDMSFEKNKITIRERVFEKGLGTHAPSITSIDLNGKGIWFRATIGLDDESVRPLNDTVKRKKIENSGFSYDGDLDQFGNRMRGSVMFSIRGDGRSLYSSGWISHSTPPLEIEVDIKGVKKLTLVTEGGADGTAGDNADWAEARINLMKSGLENLELYSSSPELLMNQTGFLPASFKTFRTGESDGEKKFTVIEMATGEVVFKGVVTEKNGDWGKVYTGDFSSVTAPGRYFISYEGRTSVPFSIEYLQYVYNIEKHMNWFLSQRCGDPEHGFERGQHRDDGVRLDNRKHQDVSGGWHDAADLRKWGMSINGLFALSEICLSLSSENVPDFTGKKRLLDRVKDEYSWGNKYFSAMQEPAGYLMDQVGGDVFKHGDNNRYTDNISGTEDDRWIVTKPNAPVFQYMFIISHCNINIAEKLGQSDINLKNAIRCYNWAAENKIVRDIHSMGAAAVAAMKLYECTGDKNYLADAENHLRIILGRQNTTDNPVKGFIMSWNKDLNGPENDHYTFENLSYSLITPYFPVWSIVEAIRVIPDKELNQKARDAFNLYLSGYISYFDKRSSYGNIPLAMYRNNPGGDRKAGDYFYRWCYVNHKDNEWWNGINPLLGYAGAYLVRGGMLTGNQDAIRIGQQQIDFIYGCNPFNASTVTGLGYNQPEYFKTSEFVPVTPLTVGAVMAGIGSSDEDQPVLLPGWWQTTEYWMEAVAGTMMALNELNNYQFSKK
jgi:hypothetical protein